MTSALGDGEGVPKKKMLYGGCMNSILQISTKCGQGGGQGVQKSGKISDVIEVWPYVEILHLIHIALQGGPAQMQNAVPSVWCPPICEDHSIFFASRSQAELSVSLC